MRLYSESVLWCTGLHLASQLFSTHTLHTVIHTPAIKSPRNPQTSKMSIIVDKWAVTMVSGGKPVMFPGQLSFPAVSSIDGKHSIVILAHQLRVYFLQTRQCIRTVELDVSDAVAVSLDPGNENQLVFFTPSSVFYVNWQEKLENIVVAKQELQPALPGLTDAFYANEKFYLAITTRQQQLSVVKIDREYATTTILFQYQKVVHHAVSKNGQKLAVVLDTHTLAIFDLTCLLADTLSDTEQAQQAVAATIEKHNAPQRPATCVAVSDDGVVAFGILSGVIQVAYTGFGKSHPAKQLRWHMDPVRSLAFSHDQQFLVSGGNEKVLVFWHLDTDHPQFLPRLAGPIDRIFVDANRPDHYLVAMRVDEAGSLAPAHEILTLSALDLVSRLAVSPIRPNFASAATSLAAKLEKTRANTETLKVDITAPVVVHPTTRHLYCATGPAIQAFDVVKGEQAFVQHAAPQLSIGRVKSEHKVADPSVSQVAFTPSGSWMATFDSMPTLHFDNLMLKNDTSYALKFWKLGDAGWQLALKVVDPHGPGLDVGTVFSGVDESFTSVDVKGGVRVWKPKAANLANVTSHKNAPATVWSLRRSSVPAAHVGRVAGCYSPDGSLLVVAHGFHITAMDPRTLTPVQFALPVCETPIEKIAIAGTHLVIASQLRLVSFDLVKGATTQLAAKVVNAGVGNLVAVDTSRLLIAVATNEYSRKTGKLTGKLLVFSPENLQPVYSGVYPQAISSVSVTSAGFVVVDSESRVGVLAPQTKSNLADSDDDLVAQMEKVLVSAQAAANVLHARTAEQKAQKVANGESAEKWTSHKLIDTAVLQPIFTNVDGVSIDTLFERIVRAVQ